MTPLPQDTTTRQYVAYEKYVHNSMMCTIKIQKVIIGHAEKDTLKEKESKRKGVEGRRKMENPNDKSGSDVVRVRTHDRAKRG